MSVVVSPENAKQELVGRICSLIAKAIAQPVDRVFVEDKLDTLGIDSMAMIEISVSLEEHFGLVMPDLDSPDAARIKTVGDLVELVARKLNSRQKEHGHERA